MGSVYGMGKSERSGTVAGAERSESKPDAKAASQTAQTEAASEALTGNPGAPGLAIFETWGF